MPTPGPADTRRSTLSDLTAPRPPTHEIVGSLYGDNVYPYQAGDPENAAATLPGCRDRSLPDARVSWRSAHPVTSRLPPPASAIPSWAGVTVLDLGRHPEPDAFPWAHVADPGLSARVSSVM